MPPEPVGSTVSVQTSSDDIVEVDQEVIPTSANVIEDSIEIMEEEESGNNNNNNFFKTSLIQYKSKIDIQQLELFSSCVHSSRGQLRLLKKQT